MQTMRFTVTGIVAAAVLAVGVQAALSFQNAGEAQDRYTILLKDVKLKTKNAKGEDWDAFEGKPDIRVYIKNRSEPKSKDFTSDTKENTFTATYNVPTITLREGQELEIHVYDVDVAFNDEAGKKTVKVTREHIDKGTVELSFGQVELLRFSCQKAANDKDAVNKNK